jgi:proteasome accessory factor A
MLVLRLLERNSLEHLPYNEFQAIEDLHRINLQTHNWEMRGVRPMTMKAVDVQGFYLNQVASNLPNPSPLERLVISMWKEVLTRLSTDPAETFGLVDWTTKRSLIEQVRATSEGMNYLPQTIDLTYHNIDRGVGLYFGLEADGSAERLVSPTTVRHYASTPPRTTRAWARGQAIRLGERARAMGLGEVEVCCTWQFVNVYVQGSSDKDLFLQLSDPRRSYAESIDALKRRLGAA